MAATDQQIEIFETKEPYTRIYNSLIQDSRLRLQTRAVLIMMLSKPKDWDFSVRGMAKVAGVTKDTMAKMIKELEETGYLRRKAQLHGEGGRFGKAGFIVYPFAQPQDYVSQPENYDTAESEAEADENTSPCPNFPCPVQPYTENSPQVINKQVNILPPIVPQGGRGVRKRKEPREHPDWKPERFEGFWKFYPQKGRKAKQAAMDAWDKLRPSDELIATIGMALTKQKREEGWMRGIGIPYASTYLNQRRWEDVNELPDTAEMSRPPEEPKGELVTVFDADGRKRTIWMEE